MCRLWPTGAEALRLMEFDRGGASLAGFGHDDRDERLQLLRVAGDAGVDDHVHLFDLAVRRQRQLRCGVAADEIRDAEKAFPQADRLEVRGLETGGLQSVTQSSTISSSSSSSANGCDAVTLMLLLSQPSSASPSA